MAVSAQGTNTPSRLYRRRMGEILIAQGVITEDQLEEALVIQKKTGELLGSILLDLGFVAESDIAKIICVQYQLPFISLRNYEFDHKLVRLFPAEFLVKNRALPFDRIGDTLLLMISEIPSEEVLAEIPKVTKLGAALYVGYPSEVQHYLAELFPALFQGERPQGGSADSASAATKGSDRAAAAKPKAEATLPDDTPPPLELVSDEAEEDVEGDKGQVASGQGGGLFGEASKSFLDELDSTWESIFSGISGTKEEPDENE